jgi:hypothetical protein
VKTNKIRFVYRGDYANQVHDRPQPSSKTLPKWFQDMPPYEVAENNPEGKIFMVTHGASNATAKKCTPMLDAMTTGYTVSLWSDVLVRQTATGPDLSWRVHSQVIMPHGASGQLIPAPPGYHQAVYKYVTDFRVETPSGYSIMVKPPAGYYDLPFMPLTAIIDSDKSVIDTNIPIWIKSDFEGIVERGTPIAQIIPFKRENWEMETDMITEEQFLMDLDKGFSKTLINNYVKHHKSQKRFI